LPFTLAIANKGYVKACRDYPHLMAGLKVHRGALTYQAVADFQKREFTPAERALA
jgi:alanine dehydrogenase